MKINLNEMTINGVRYSNRREFEKAKLDSILCKSFLNKRAFLSYEHYKALYKRAERI